MKKTIYGLVGYKGKLGSLLLEQPNFVPIDCDVTSPASVRRTYREDVDVLVNCAAVSSIDECEKDDRYALRVNVRGAINLLDVYKSKVLNISSDYVFPGWNVLPPTEKSKQLPVNDYGMTKVIMENHTLNAGAKIIRLSRTVSREDLDISIPLTALYYGKPVDVPSFLYRNYMTRRMAADGIIYFLQNFSRLPSVINYGSSAPVSFYTFMSKLAKQENLPEHLLGKRTQYDSLLTPRPKKAGFSVGLAKRWGFPIHSIDDVVRFL